MGKAKSGKRMRLLRERPGPKLYSGQDLAQTLIFKYQQSEEELALRIRSECIHTSFESKIWLAASILRAHFTSLLPVFETAMYVYVSMFICRMSYFLATLSISLCTRSSSDVTCQSTDMT